MITHVHPYSVSFNIYMQEQNLCVPFLVLFSLDLTVSSSEDNARQIQLKFCAHASLSSAESRVITLTVTASYCRRFLRYNIMNFKVHFHGILHFKILL